MRVTYPELAQLSDASLFYLYDQYQSSCNYLNSWSIYREDHFILFLLGELLSSKNLDGYNTIKAGIVIAYGLLQDLSKEEAIMLGKEWCHYDQELTIITQYVAEVMQFLAEDQNTQHLQGDKIYNTSDIFRVGRIKLM